MVQLILDTAKKQKQFCHKKGDKKNLDSDFEVILNAKGPMVFTPYLCVCVRCVYGMCMCACVCSVCDVCVFV